MGTHESSGVESRSVSPHMENTKGETPSTASPTRPLRSTTRSCLACNRKKVKCNKEQPSCSSCTRASKPCVYPPPGPRVRRPRKTIIADLASRISDLEKSIPAERTHTPSHVFKRHGVSAPVSAETVSLNTHVATPDTIHTTGTGHRSRGDILVQSGSASQYFNEVLLSRVIREEEGIQSSLTTPRHQPTNPLFSPFNPLGILSSPCFSVRVSSLHPPKHIALKLWSIYVDKVDACAGAKVLHIPSDELKVCATLDDPARASFENLTLCMAIYFGAAVALDGQETQAIVGDDKQVYLDRFRYGLEQGFAQGDFLDNPTLSVLQALAIYLSALRVHHRGKGTWILNGLLIRIAQALGLQRTGEVLGLSPFQSEIRRRVWWHLFCRDGHVGEDHGLQDAQSLSRMSEVSLPLNVDDADLCPDMKELPAPRKKWTAMTFGIISIDVGTSLHRLAAIVESSTPSAPPTEDSRVQITNGLKTRMEELLAYCNPVIPRQRHTILISRFLFRKVDLISKQQWQVMRSPETREECATEANLVEALEILELGLSVSTDDMLRTYEWSSRAYPQYHTTLFVLWLLCVKPEGPSVDRAWGVIEAIFKERGDCLAGGFDPKLVVLTALRTKAETTRRKVQGVDRVHGEAQGAQFSVSKSGYSTPAVRGPALSIGHMDTQGLDLDMGIDGLGLEVGSGGWPDWATLVQGVNSTGPAEGQAFYNALWH